MRLSRGAAQLQTALLLVLAAGVAEPPCVFGSAPERQGACGVASEQQAGAQAANSQTKSDDPATAGAAMHSITLTFDYDFTKTPACSEKVKRQCVAKFSVYDISGDKRYFLFSTPVPDGAHGLMKGITATSPRLLFAVGKHRIAVSAQDPDGKESPPHDCKTVIEIKAADTDDASGSHR